MSAAMSRTTRRYKALQQSNGGGSLPGCDRVRQPRARVLLLCLLGVLVLSLVLGFYLSSVADISSGGHVPLTDLTKDRVRGGKKIEKSDKIDRTRL